MTKSELLKEINMLQRDYLWMQKGDVEIKLLELVKKLVEKLPND